MESKNKRNLVLYLVRGISGSGKSTYAKELCGEFVVEADQYFVNENGEYVFDPLKLKQAHDFCFKKAFDLFSVSEKVAVANTFTRLSEMKRYLDEAKRRKINVEIVEPLTSWRYNVQECAKRNLHGLTEKMIEKQLSRWEVV